MNRRSTELLEQARANIRRFAQDREIVAAMLTGSVARGNADGASDIDTIFFLAEALPQERFESIRAAALESGGGFYGGTAEGFGVYQIIGGVKCDFGFALCSATDALIADVLERCDPDLDKQLIIGGIREAIPLLGAEILQDWVERSDSYPDALAETMVRHHLAVTPLWLLRRMGADRDDRVFLAECYLENTKRILGVLCGLNRVYHPGKLKGLRRMAAHLRIAPHNCIARLEALFAQAPAVAVEELGALMEESIALVERHMPAVDTGPVRARLMLSL